MATERLKPCKTCGTEVSNRAKTCPHCGRSMPGGGVPTWVVVLTLAAAAWFFVTYVGLPR